MTTYLLLVVLLPLQFFVEVQAFVPQNDFIRTTSSSNSNSASASSSSWWLSSFRHDGQKTETRSRRVPFCSCDTAPSIVTRRYVETPTTSSSSADVATTTASTSSSSSSSFNTTTYQEDVTPTPASTAAIATTPASGSFGNLLMKMQRRARRSRRQSGRNSGSNLTVQEEEISSLELNATTDSIMSRREEYDETADEDDILDDAAADDDKDYSYLGTSSSPKSSLSSFRLPFGAPASTAATKKQPSSVGNGGGGVGVFGSGGDLKTMDWKTALELDQDVKYLFPWSVLTKTAAEQQQVDMQEAAFVQNKVVELPLDKRQLMGQQAHLLDLQRRQRLTTSSVAAATTTAAVRDDDAQLRFSSTAAAQRSFYQRRRIQRDLTMAAVSVAANTDTVAEWRNACRLMNGIYPLVHDAIRQGAAVLEQSGFRRSTSTTGESPSAATLGNEAAAAFEKSSASSTGAPDYYNLNPQSASLEAYNRRRLLEEEASLQIACMACRAIRDLCALSPEMATVITDTLLRYNQARNGELMQDFCTLLEYKHHYHASAAVTNMVNSDENHHRLFKRQRRRFRYRVQKFRGGFGGYMSDQQLLRARVTKRKKNRNQRDARRQCQLYVTQLLLAMTVASDHAVHAIRNTNGLSDAILACSSYTGGERRRRWLRYPGEMIKWLWRSSRITRTWSRQQEQQPNRGQVLRRPFLEAATLGYDLNGQIQRTSNQVLAAIGCNQWIPKIPGQRGLRILALDGGGSRGMVSVTAVACLVEAATNGVEVSDAFDMIVGTSTGGIISFLTGLRRETSVEALNRYNQLIKQIFVKSALSTPLLLFTTASYDESHFMDILGEILQDESMLDSRADPAVPYVFAVTSKMSSTPTHIALFRNYNYGAGELPDPFTINAETARQDLNLPLELEHPDIQAGNYPQVKDTSSTPHLSRSDRRGGRNNGKGEQRVGSRNPGSFRVLQRYALRASTAAPTVFKPVLMGGEMYCDGGIVASNPAAVAIHEARALFPNTPIELIVSLGTGAFKRQKSPSRIGWDGIVNQIVDSATDAEAVHHVLEDVLGEPEMLGRRSLVSQTRYYRFNPTIGLPDEFPIDVTDPEKLAKLRRITRNYMNEPEQKAKMQDISDILLGRHGWKKWWRR